MRQVALKGNDAALMEKIMKAVNARLDDSDFNVEALADEVGLSRVQLHRRMKELTGITVGEFIRNLRLQQAAKLLAKGDTTVAQVTYAVGFAPRRSCRPDRIGTHLRERESSTAHACGPRYDVYRPAWRHHGRVNSRPQCRLHPAGPYVCLRSSTGHIGYR